MGDSCMEYGNSCTFEQKDQNVAMDGCKSSIHLLEPQSFTFCSSTEEEEGEEVFSAVPLV